jgi:hypothetical protein
MTTADLLLQGFFALVALFYSITLFGAVAIITTTRCVSIPCRPSPLSPQSLINNITTLTAILPPFLAVLPLLLWSSPRHLWRPPIIARLAEHVRLALASSVLPILSPLSLYTQFGYHIYFPNWSFSHKALDAGCYDGYFDPCRPATPLACMASRIHHGTAMSHDGNNDSYGQPRLYCAPQAARSSQD